MSYKIEKSENGRDILIVTLPNDKGNLRIGYIDNKFLIFHFDKNDQPLPKSKLNKVR